MTSPSAALRRSSDGVLSWVDGIGSLRAVEMLRISAGPIVIAHLWPFLQDALDGVAYSDRFYEPYAAWYPEASAGIYLALLWLSVGAAVALTAGFLTRITSAYVAAFVTYNLFLSRTHFWHNRAFLVVMLAGMALLPLGRVMSIDGAVRRWRSRPQLSSDGRLWPLMLMRFEVVVVFLGSGVSKLVDADWWGGTVTRLRVVQWRGVAEDRGVPDWVLDLLATEGFHVWFAKVAVLTEIVIGLGLLHRRTRFGAIWVAVVFHISIEVVASVQVFSVVALAALVIWIVPSSEDRRVIVNPRVMGGRFVAFAVRRLDWTGRFGVVEEAAGNPPVALVDRAGVHMRGAAAARVILSRLPVTFMLAAPFNLAGLRWLRDRSTAGPFGPSPRRIETG